MQDSGITRSLDRQGRIVIPKEIRDAFDVDTGDPVSFWIDREENIICLKPAKRACLCCGTQEDLKTIRDGFFLCRACIETLR